MNQPKRAAEITTSEYISMLLWGMPGTGKTTLALMMYPNEEKLLVDMDRKGLETIKAIKDEGLRNKILKNTHIWTPEHTRLSGDKIDIAKMPMFDKQKNVIPGTGGFVPTAPKGYREVVDFINSLDGKCPYHTVILDPLTLVDEHLYWAILADHKIGVFTQSLWGVYKTNMMSFVKGFLSLPANRIITCHEMTRTDDDTNETFVRPAIQGSYRDQLGKEFSEVYYVQGRQADGKYKALTIGNNKYSARTCRPEFTNQMLVEDIAKVYA